MFCISDPNLVMLASTADELSCGQASDWYTHTHGQTQAMTIPEGQNWPWVIKWHQCTTLGSHWRYFLALVISGRRRWGSSVMAGWFTISLLPPTKVEEIHYASNTIKSLSLMHWLLRDASVVIPWISFSQNHFKDRKHEHFQWNFLQKNGKKSHW